MQSEAKIDGGVDPVRKELRTAAQEQESYQQIAQTILKQLGGQRFIVMTGAKNFGQDKGILSFALPAKSGYVKNGITHIRIELTPLDLYKMTFLRVRKSPKLGYSIETVSEFDGVYWDQLQEIFTRETGLDTHL